MTLLKGSAKDSISSTTTSLAACLTLFADAALRLYGSKAAVATKLRRLVLCAFMNVYGTRNNSLFYFIFCSLNTYLILVQDFSNGNYYFKFINTCVYFKLIKIENIFTML